MKLKEPKFWYQNKNSVGKILFSPISKIIYTLGKNRFKNVDGYKGKVPIICIGNAVVGGVGKTPTCIYISDLVRRLGLNPCFLTRGYGGKSEGVIRVDQQKHSYKEVGDEALLLANYAPVFVAQNRVEGANIASKSAIDVIIMDDGLQNHPSLLKNCVFLVIDSYRGFGNAALIPAGPLREPIDTAFDKSDAVFLIGNNEMPNQLKTYSKPIFQAEKKILDHGFMLNGTDIMAFCGIGNPEQFFESLKNAGANLVKTRIFADHEPYNKMVIERMIFEAMQLGVPLVTTEKDMVRIDSIYYQYIIPILLQLNIPQHEENRLIDFLEQKLFS